MIEFSSQEAEWLKPDKPVSPAWPERGAVQFIDYKVRYREGLDLVLKGLSFSVRGGEKVCTRQCCQIPRLR